MSDARRHRSLVPRTICIVVASLVVTTASLWWSGRETTAARESIERLRIERERLQQEASLLESRRSASEARLIEDADRVELTRRLVASLIESTPADRLDLLWASTHEALAMRLLEATLDAVAGRGRGSAAWRTALLARMQEEADRLVAEERVPDGTAAILLVVGRPGEPDTDH